MLARPAISSEPSSLASRPLQNACTATPTPTTKLSATASGTGGSWWWGSIRKRRLPGPGGREAEGPGGGEAEGPGGAKRRRTSVSYAVSADPEKEPHT